MVHVIVSHCVTSLARPIVHMHTLCGVSMCCNTIFILRIKNKHVLPTGHLTVFVELCAEVDEQKIMSSQQSSLLLNTEHVVG
jgi:hypothetical protein